MEGEEAGRDALFGPSSLQGDVAGWGGTVLAEYTPGDFGDLFLVDDDDGRSESVGTSPSAAAAASAPAPAPGGVPNTLDPPATVLAPAPVPSAVPGPVSVSAAPPAAAGDRKRGADGAAAGGAAPVKRQKRANKEYERRLRLGQGFDELGRLLGCPDASRETIIMAAVTKLRDAARAPASAPPSASSSAPAVVVPSTFARGADQFAWGRAIFSRSDMPMAIISPGGEIVECNTAFCTMTGAARSDLIGHGRTIFSFMLKKALTVMFAVISRMLTGNVMAAEVLQCFVRADNTVFRARTTLSALKSNNGTVTHIQCIVMPSKPGFQSHTATSAVCEGPDGCQLAPVKAEPAT